MDDQQNQPTNDVNTQTDTQTVVDSSSTQQTPDGKAQDTSATTSENGGTQTSGTLADGSNADSKIPLHVFTETKETLKATQKELAEMRAWRTQQEAQRAQAQQQANPEVYQAKQQLAGLIKELAPELGFVSREEIQRQNAFNEVNQTHQNLAQKYNGKDGLPRYDAEAVTQYATEVLGMTSAKGLESAYKQMHEAEIMNARLQQMLKQTRGVQSETSNGSGSANTGVADSDLKKAAADGDEQAIHTLLLRRLKGK